MLYSDWITRVATLLEVPITSPWSSTPSSDPNFNNIYPACIDFVENRLQRELDFINTIVTDKSASTTGGQRSFTYPTDVGTFVVVNQLSLVVSGVRQPPLTPVSREFLDFTYPAEAAPTTPSYPLYWAPVNGVSALLGPSPDTAYSVEVVGTIRVTPLSATNTSNFLTLSLPDLYVAASMSWLCAYQRDFGAQSSDPTMAMSWEQTYKTLYAGAEVEELRKKFRSIGSSSRIPSPLAAQPGT